MKERTVKKTFLIIDDDRIFCDAVRDHLADRVDVVTANRGADGVTVCSQRRVDVVLLDQQLPDAEGYTLCPSILKHNGDTKIIFSTAYPSFDNAIKALKAGAFDYLTKPFELEELDLALERAFRTLDLEQVEQLQNYQSAKESEEAVIIGGNDLAETQRLVQLAAESESPVLITGETGTGKTLVAKAIHYRSKRSGEPFFSINCAALPENLIEAELFGHEKGAFTGAVATKKGIIEMAEGGTLFLDEIGEMPLHLQAKLLSVVEDKSMRRVGGVSMLPVNVRFIAATGVDLESTLGKTFRKDLYYRLSVIRIHMPPLRERSKDIPELCSHLLKKMGFHDVRLPDTELSKLTQYKWPGNVRELKNILERAAILHKGTELRPSELLGKTSEIGKPVQQDIVQADGIITLDELEKKHIRLALDRLSGNYTRAAKALGISLSTLKRKLKTLG